MNESQIYEQLLGIQNSIGGLDAKVDNLTKEVELIHRYEKRLGRVEGDVRTIRRVFGGLFSMLLAAGVAAVSWLKS